MAYENYTVRQFMNAWFNEDYSCISKEEFEICYTEYLDASGLYQSDMFDKKVYITYLHNRVTAVSLEVKLQRDFLNEFGVPYKSHFDFILNEFGYVLSWEDDTEKFEKLLKRIEAEEKMYLSDLESSIKDLEELKKSESKVEYSKKEQRLQFVRMVNSLGKVGFKIDNDKTTVEELSIMIKQQMEENSNV